MWKSAEGKSEAGDEDQETASVLMFCGIWKTHLLSVCAHLYGIRNQTRGFLFRHGADVFQPNCELHTEQHKLNSTPISPKVWVTVNHTSVSQRKMLL